MACNSNPACSPATVAGVIQCEASSLEGRDVCGFLLGSCRNGFLGVVKYLAPEPGGNGQFLLMRGPKVKGSGAESENKTTYVT